jgi:hypothetical protein
VRAWLPMKATPEVVQPPAELARELS